MFIIRVPMHDRLFLRRTWYLTEEAWPELRSRWTVEASLMPEVRSRVRTEEARNRLVTNACDTNTMTACA